MALRRIFGFSDGELMRADAKPCSRLMRQTAGIFTVGGGLAFWILCRLHYGLYYVLCWSFLPGYLFYVETTFCTLNLLFFFTHPQPND
ncbi:hypothetical protein I3843_04G102900 [Carya illinoinensis]|uniref:DUF7875 domain-containing protein n=1 Tax=Carya illinoinensis TaxID=32201 RepID=A0A922JV41_CARIL|nr:hypothetical protein I3760_04G110600 [Carya illinoinensis]KAG6717622.1 hypothetical protein I3842_04G110000 [Carya illinoinensis]KAG7983373.1 hypothetical protein I3843_04G102900 [Carya illinoinensis]